MLLGLGGKLEGISWDDSLALVVEFFPLFRIFLELRFPYAIGYETFCSLFQYNQQTWMQYSRYGFLGDYNNWKDHLNGKILVQHSINVVWESRRFWSRILIYHKLNQFHAWVE